VSTTHSVTAPYDHTVNGCTTCVADAKFLRSRRRPAYESATPRIRIVDLFAGGGGLSLGLAEAAHRIDRGVRIKAAVEIDLDAADVYALNFPDADIYDGDVATLFTGRIGRSLNRAEREFRAELGPVDVVLAGPPCQGHSDLNNHTRRIDPRNELYVLVARAAEVLEPRCILVENVPTVCRDAAGSVPATMAALEKSGYRVATTIIDLTDLGVPQRRRRHILLASCDDRVQPSTILTTRIPCESHDPRTVRWAIEDLLTTESHEGIDSPTAATATNRRRMQWLIEEDRYDLPNMMRPTCHHDEHTYLSMYGRLHWDAPAQTITTGYGSMGQGRYVHPARARTITPHEAARLQTFPDFFEFGRDKPRKTWAHVIGNAVPPLLGVHIGQPLLEAMTGRSRARESPTTVRARRGVPRASSQLIRKRMSSTRQRDTNPELMLRAELDRYQLEYEVDHPVDGTRRRADIVFPAAKIAAFVDGCYWHGCPDHGTTPKSNRAWWQSKFAANRARDLDTDLKLTAAGWMVFRYWEHDDLVTAAAEVAKAVVSRANGHQRTNRQVTRSPKKERSLLPH